MKSTAAVFVTALLGGMALTGCGGGEEAARQPRATPTSSPTTLNAYQQRLKENAETEAKQEAREAAQGATSVGYLAFLRGTVGAPQLAKLGTDAAHLRLGNDSCRALDRGYTVSTMRYAVRRQGMAPEVLTLYVAGATRYLCPEYNGVITAVMLDRAMATHKVTRAEQDAKAARRARIEAAARRERIAKAQAAKRKKREAQAPATGSGSACATGYSPCVPPFPPDLDCADVGGPVTVTGSDPHGLDAEGDGRACE